MFQSLILNHSLIFVVYLIFNYQIMAFFKIHHAIYHFLKINLML